MAVIVVDIIMYTVRGLLHVTTVVLVVLLRASPYIPLLVMLLLQLHLNHACVAYITIMEGIVNILHGDS